MEIPFYAFLISLFVIPPLAWFATKFDHIDYPGGHKQHSGTVPLAGGFAITIGVISALAIKASVTSVSWIPLLLSTALMLGIGAADDRRLLGIYPRLAAQAVCALIMIYWGGEQLHSLGAVSGYEIVLPEFIAIPLTVFAVVGAINALNMTDGKDGLAGGLSLITSMSLVSLAFYKGSPTEVSVLLTLIGALVAFLIYALRTPWRSKAAIFLGNSGSMALGLILAWYMTSFSQGPDPIMRPATALWIFSVPLFDMFSVIIRRTLSGQSPFSPDQLHIHHLLNEMGYSSAKTVGIILLFSLLMAVTGIIADVNKTPLWLLFGSYIGMFLVYTRLYFIASKRYFNNGSTGINSQPSGR